MIDISLGDSNKGANFDLFIGCVGYEHRSLAALRKIHSEGFAGNSVLFDYKSGDLFSYLKNSEDPLVTLSGTWPDFKATLLQVEKYITENSDLTILFDVTSFDREKIAFLLQLIFKNYSFIKNVTLCYFPSKFIKPTHHLDILRSFGPVIPAFIGENSYSRDSLTMVIGAGYELGRAIGAIDLLEPDRVYCMTPIGTDPQFEKEILKNNLDFSFLDNDELLQTYDLLQPERLFYEMRRIVDFEIQQRNVLILPLGPKIFAAVSILIASIFHPSVMVWRHSTASKKDPNSIMDAHASGIDIRLTFKFQKTESPTI